MAGEKPIIYETQDQMPELVMSQASTLWNHTGSWRYIKPCYLNKVPPCNQGCPAGNDIENFISLVEKEKYQEAWLSIKEENPFPKICGRVCYHPCETACNRAQHDRAVSINAIERFVGDMAPKDFEIKKLREPTGKKVCVVGAGPAGLSAAYHLARLGHEVTVYDKNEKPGGVLRYGIPEYRLPNHILDEEINDVVRLGVKINSSQTIGKDVSWNDLNTYDAIFVAIGVHKSTKLGLQGEDLAGVMPGLEFLKKVANQEKVNLGNKVVVVGGGNTAIDAARCAKRLGSEVEIFYYRSRVEMPAFAEEVDEAEKEGVKFNILTRPKAILSDNGVVTGIEMYKTRLGDPDESGRRRPVTVEGSEFKVKANTIITAIGEKSDLDFFPKELCNEWGQVKVNALGATDKKAVFSGGDVALDQHNVSVAIGSGKSAAIGIDSYLMGKELTEVPEKIIIGQMGSCSMSHYMEQQIAHTKSRGESQVVSYDTINKNYFEVVQRSLQKKTELRDRENNFKEVSLGLTKEEIKHDVSRCFHCGVCTMCDNCYTFCPDVAIMPKQGTEFGYDINFDYCKGCGICVHECPRNAMKMEDE